MFFSLPCHAKRKPRSGANSCMYNVHTMLCKPSIKSLDSPVHWHSCLQIICLLWHCLVWHTVQSVGWLVKSVDLPVHWHTCLQILWLLWHCLVWCIVQSVGWLDSVAPVIHLMSSTTHKHNVFFFIYRNMQNRAKNGVPKKNAVQFAVCHYISFVINTLFKAKLL